MSKVYLVSTGEYDDYQVEYIYTSRCYAEYVAKKICGRISCYKLDQEFISRLYDGHWCYVVCFNKKHKFQYCNCVDEREYAVGDISLDPLGRTMVYVEAENCDVAINKGMKIYKKYLEDGIINVTDASVESEIIKESEEDSEESSEESGE